MRCLSVEQLIIGSATLFITFSFASAIPSIYAFRNRGCAEHCLGGCHTRGPGKCDRLCKPSYSLQRWSGKCVAKCGVGCASCIRLQATTIHHCRSCKLGFRLRIKRRTGETFCAAIPPPTPKPTACDLYCVGGCATQGTGKCDSKCKPNYILDVIDHQCKACDVHCKPTTPGNCASPGTCNSDCIDGYALETATQQCVPCSPGCTGGCVITGPYLCDGVCSADYVYVPDLKICQPCDPNCAVGCKTSGSGFCDGACKAGYGPAMFISKCVACDSHCSVGCNTNGGGYCDGSCTPGFAIDSSSDTCAPCQQAPCAPNVVCTAPGTCAPDYCPGPYSYNTALQICL